MAKPTRFTPDMTEEYISKGLWEDVSVSDLWDHHAENEPDKEAIVAGDTRLTRLQMKKWTDRIALGLLDMGMKRDDAVIMQLPNWAETFMLRIALTKAGILSSFLPMTMRHNEIQRIADGMDAVGAVVPLKFRNFDYLQMIQDVRGSLPSLKRVFVVAESVPPEAVSLREMAEQPIDTRYPADYLQRTKFSAYEVSLILSSTGTTGQPKLCETVDATSVLLAKSFAERIQLTADDTMGVLAPLSGGPGFAFAWWVAAFLGTKVVLLDWFDLESALQAIEREKVTFLTAVPTQIIRLADHPTLSEHDISSLRTIRYGGAALSYHAAMRAEEKLGARITSGYGSTDATGITQNRRDDPPEVRWMTVGKVMTGNEIKLVDETGNEVPQGGVGEVRVRGAGTSSGYYRDLELTKQVWGTLGRDGWFRSGDLGKFDEQGNLILVGRSKDMIIRGGQNIYPKEIEDILSTHPKVSEVAIVGMPDSVMGEKACAYVALLPGQRLGFDEMTSFLKEKRIAPFKLPERLEIIDRIPKVADVQKTDKNSLRQDILAKLKAEGRL